MEPGRNHEDPNAIVFLVPVCFLKCHTLHSFICVCVCLCVCLFFIPSTFMCVRVLTSQFRSLIVSEVSSCFPLIYVIPEVPKFVNPFQSWELGTLLINIIPSCCLPVLWSLKLICEGNKNIVLPKTYFYSKKSLNVLLHDFWILIFCILVMTAVFSFVSFLVMMVFRIFMKTNWKKPIVIWNLRENTAKRDW